LKGLSEEELIKLVSYEIELPALKGIDLQGMKITDAGVKVLAENAHKMPNLQILWLQNNQITKTLVEALKKEFKIKFDISV